MMVAAGWIQDDWIFSDDASQSGKFWIQDNWIWGPKGAADENTQHWIAGGWIFGPSARLPFARPRWE